MKAKGLIVDFLASDSIERWARSDFRLFGEKGASVLITIPHEVLDGAGLKPKDLSAGNVRIFLPEERESLQGYAHSEHGAGHILVIVETPDKRNKR